MSPDIEAGLKAAWGTSDLGLIVLVVAVFCLGVLLGKISNEMP